MSLPDKILLASGNQHKIEELRQVLKPLGIKLISTKIFKDAEEVVEDRPDLEGNALKKARYWHQKSGLPSLADDTGLEVDALGGAPGVRSARYAGENATYEQNVDKLLRELDGKNNRKAQFRTVIAFITDDGEKLFEGVCGGKIIEMPRGGKGFGYDPVFRPENYDQTFAELSSHEKNKISHRGRALQKFIEYLS